MSGQVGRWQFSRLLQWNDLQPLRVCTGCAPKLRYNSNTSCPPCNFPLCLSAYSSVAMIVRVPVAAASDPSLHNLRQEIEQWVQEIGWGSRGVHILSTHTIAEILDMGPPQLQALIRCLEPHAFALPNSCSHTSARTAYTYSYAI